MSYDLNIWSRQRVETDQKEIKVGEHTITLTESVMVENEDIPTDVMLSLAEIKYLTSIYLQPYTNEKTITDKAIKCAKELAKEFNGIVENPQCENNIILVDKTKTFTRSIRNADKISISWYVACEQSLSNQMTGFIELLEKYLPQALPRRYGAFEPPEFKYSVTGKNHLISFLNSEHSPVIYCTKPVTHIFISDAYIYNQKYKVKDYRCNKIEIELLKEAYIESNWQFAAKRFFIEVARLFKPFYAEIIDEKQSMICSWWWKGIPLKRGNPVIIGEPYSTLCGELPDKNRIESGLYYFENDMDNVKIPRKLISYKKLFSINKMDVGFFADNYKYAKSFPLNS